MEELCWFAGMAGRSWTICAVILPSALALLAQMPDLIARQFVDLPATAHEGFDNSSACLGTWNDRRELRWRWKDHADEQCGVASRRA